MIARLKLWFAAIFAVAVAILTAWAAGRSSANQKHELDNLKSYRDTRNRIDETDPINDVGDADRWLRNRITDRDL